MCAKNVYRMTKKFKLTYSYNRYRTVDHTKTGIPGNELMTKFFSKGPVVSLTKSAAFTEGSVHLNWRIAHIDRLFEF